MAAFPQENRCESSRRWARGCATCTSGGARPALSPPSGQKNLLNPPAQSAKLNLARSPQHRRRNANRPFSMGPRVPQQPPTRHPAKPAAGCPRVPAVAAVMRPISSSRTIARGIRPPSCEARRCAGLETARLLCAGLPTPHTRPGGRAARSSGIRTGGDPLLFSSRKPSANTQHATGRTTKCMNQASINSEKPANVTRQWFATAHNT